MTEHKDDSDDASISARVPVKFVVTVIAAVLFGGMGLNTALFNATPSDERAEFVKLVSSLGQQIVNYGTLLTNTDSRVEALRIDVLQRSSAHYSKADQERYAQEQERKHDELEATDAQLRRSIEALERAVDKMEGRQ
jgi:hypothetical protein